jgi:sulfoxide reductase heme-binding subunit YedZ
MWKSRWLKPLVAALCLSPLVWLGWEWYHQRLGINSIEYVARFTGRWTLRLLLVTLAITPLRRLPGLNPLIRLRRMLGLITFLYAVLHGVHYFGRDAQWNLEVIVEDLTFRRFFIAGAVALALMIPLAATSFDAAVRRLGRRWQHLHRLIYFSAAAAIVHYVWLAKGLTLTPLYYGAILLALLIARVAFWTADRRRRLRPRATG